MPNETMNPSIKNTRAAEYNSIYANNAAVMTSMFDLCMFFGEIQGNVNGVLEVEQKVKVIMSPIQAKIFSILLRQQLSLFEDAFGELKVTPDQVPIELHPFLERYNEEFQRYKK